jgi:hypothetical protein
VGPTSGLDATVKINEDRNVVNILLDRLLLHLFPWKLLEQVLTTKQHTRNVMKMTVCAFVSRGAN